MELRDCDQFITYSAHINDLFSNIVPYKCAYYCYELMALWSLI